MFTFINLLMSLFTVTFDSSGEEESESSSYTVSDELNKEVAVRSPKKDMAPANRQKLEIKQIHLSHSHKFNQKGN